MKRLTFAAAAVAAFVAAPATAESPTYERVDLSAPLLPKVLELYQYEGANYPQTQEAREQAAVGLSMTFEELLVACAPHYPGITLQAAGGAPLTAEQLTANFDLVAQCSYERFTSKPYWIPQFVDDVDLCALKLGPAWRLPTEADLEQLDEADFAFFQQTLTAVGGNGWGGFYFSLNVYVRAKDGTLKRGSLAPGANPRVTPLGLPVGGTPTTHLEDGTVVRCIQRAPVAVR